MTVVINIFDYIEYPERMRFHHIFIPCDKYDRDFELTGKMCYHYIEIPKLKGMPDKQKELAFEEGKTLGLAEGEAKGKAEIARNLKTKNYSTSEIAELTGLSIKEIETL